MFKKPNKEQAIYSAVLLQAIAFGNFALFGAPALIGMFGSNPSKDEVITLIIAGAMFTILTLMGYFLLDEKNWRDL